jgi:hypothetical protein
MSPWRITGFPCSVRVVSWRDMILFEIAKLNVAIKGLEICEAACRASPLVESTIEAILLFIGILDDASKAIELTEPPKRVAFIRELLKVKQGGLFGTPSVDSDLAQQLAFLRELIESGLGERHFLFLPPNKKACWDNPRLFGDAVYDAFEEAREEIRQAGNCYATESYTACVFHAVRVAEYGMRVLARRLGIRKGRCNRPLEYEEWGGVIQLVDKKLDKLRLKRRGPQREALLQFYTSAFRHCQHLNDLWRRDVTHARRSYEYAQALGALEHAQEFMQLLAGGAK